MTEGNKMSERCAECGAILPEGKTCKEIFDELQLLEIYDPAHYQVHFLSVACFMIQHGRYSDEALAWIHEKLRVYLDQELTHEQLRRLIANETSNASRKWKILRQPGAAPLPKTEWSMTIIDVVKDAPDAETYCKQVRRLARVTLEQMGSMR